MRAIDPEFQARLDGGATRMCRCWLLTRKDGVKLGFTDHDLDLGFGGVTFQAGSGLDAGAIQSSTGLAVDNGQANGALSSDGLTAADIAAGKYDGAEVRQWKVDWENPELRVLLFRGFLGEIRRGPQAFEAELRGLSEALNKPLGRAYLRDCDAVLGDRRCGVDLDVVETAVLAVVAANVVRVAGEQDDGWFAHGAAECAGSGRRAVIKSDRLVAGGRLLEFWQEVPLAAGDLLRLTAGCDKRAATCKAKFANFLNFRGFPHLPGDDWVVSYPGEGDRLDGGSLYRE